MEGIVLPINEGQLVPPFDFAMDRPQYSYLWIVVAASLLAFLSAIAMGSNDVSSTFATTVGSRAMTIKQALLSSAVFQVLGCYFLGARVVKTVGKSVADLNAFEYRPDLLMMGMMVVLIMTSVSVLLATWKGFPISTTQCIISTIVGFALCSPGSAVNWSSVYMIIGGWFVAPFLSAFVSALTFYLVRRFILRTEQALSRALLLLPLLTWLTIALNLFFVLFVSPLASRIGLTEGPGVGICLAIGFVFGLILFLLRGRFERNILEIKNKGATDQKTIEPASNTGLTSGTTNPLLVRHDVILEVPEDVELGLTQEEIHEDAAEHYNTSKALLKVFAKANQLSVKADPKAKYSVLHKEIVRILQNGGDTAQAENGDASSVASPRVVRRRVSVETFSHMISFDKQQKYFDDAEKKLPQLHTKAETFDKDAEDAFKYLQIFTALAGAFSQGANSIGNISGPLSVIVGIYNNGGAITGAASVDEWVTWLGIAGLLTGLFAFGYLVLTSVGVKMIHVTPSRGFAIGFSSSLVLAIGSFIGLPLSTTHCCVGAIAGVGLIEKPFNEDSTIQESKMTIFQRLKKAPVNWKFLAQVVAAWFVTVLFGLAFGSLLYSFATFSPSQILPMSANNCVVFYGGPGRNTTGGTFTFDTPADGFIRGIVGFSNKTVVPL